MVDNAIDLLPDFYSKLYSSEKNDSPEKSRTSLVKRIVRILESGISNNNILDIGSGPQSIERQLLSRNDSSLFEKYNFLTLDLAKVQFQKLLARNKTNVFHTQGSALILPCKSEAFGLVVSNHAIDFLPQEAFSEAFRVLQSGGWLFFIFTIQIWSRLI